MKAVLLAALACVAVSACGDDVDPAKYKQTWTTPYGDTTCADWRDTMTEREKFVMAADILYSQRKKLQEDVGLPDDALVGQFQGQIQGLCLTSPGDDVTTVSFIVWTTGEDVFAP